MGEIEIAVCEGGGWHTCGSIMFALSFCSIIVWLIPNYSILLFQKFFLLFFNLSILLIQHIIIILANGLSSMDDED